MLKNPRHEKFAQGVASGLSVTEAYKSAGFSPKGAGQSGEKLLKKTEISRRIEEIRAKLAKKLDYSREDFIRDLLERFTNLDPDSSVAAKYGEMLAKAQGWNEPDKIDLSGDAGIKIIIGGETCQGNDRRLPSS